MRIRRDPVTVIGDETHDQPLARISPSREGVGSRTIREPGDLPARRHAQDRSSREDPGDGHASVRAHPRPRHRAERPRGWTTVEEPFEIVPACRRLAGRHALVVVDCLTLWVSNRLHRGDGDEAIVDGADELAKFMAERAISLILVSNEVGTGVHPPTEVGWRFSQLLGSVNQRVAAAADRVTLMVAGIPLTIKDAPLPAGSHGRPPEAP